MPSCHLLVSSSHDTVQQFMSKLLHRGQRLYYAHVMNVGLVRASGQIVLLILPWRGTEIGIVCIDSAALHAACGCCHDTGRCALKGLRACGSCMDFVGLLACSAATATYLMDMFV